MYSLMIPRIPSCSFTWPRNARRHSSPVGGGAEVGSPPGAGASSVVVGSSTLIGAYLPSNPPATGGVAPARALPAAWSGRQRADAPTMIVTARGTDRQPFGVVPVPAVRSVDYAGAHRLARPDAAVIPAASSTPAPVRSAATPAGRPRTARTAPSTVAATSTAAVSTANSTCRSWENRTASERPSRYDGRSRRHATTGTGPPTSAALRSIPGTAALSVGRSGCLPRAAERVHIGRRGERLGPHLLRRHAQQRAHHRPRLGHPARRLRRRHFHLRQQRQTEVDHHRPVVGQDDVVRLQVPV